MFDEYPRPQMERAEWFNLCGTWDCAFTASPRPPAVWDGGEIEVPFSPEAPASGVGRALQPGEYLWYRRQVDIGPGTGRILLHFGAADQLASVFVNGVEAGSHYGGYTPFTVDITDFLDECGRGELTLAVRDDSDLSSLAHGKQRLERGGMWYTAQSGIWQPVWAERVPSNHIRGLRITPLFDEAAVLIEADPGGVVHFRGQEYPCPARVPVPDFEAWSPEHPKLYDFTVTLGEDEVKSYFAMRKFSVSEGRLCLNNKPYFHNGVLDQGYNPEGLMTYPSDEAMVRDIRLAKAMGFNTLRKHMKIEPLRWYYHCDRLGMLVWQDMPCGGGPYRRAVVTLPLFSGQDMRDDRYALFGRKDAVGRKRFTDELREMIGTLYNCPCIALWTLFNEGWGQFDASAALDLVNGLDGTRTVSHASGWHDQGVGEVRDLHVYFRKYRFAPDEQGRAVLLSEFGGYNLKVRGHTWNDQDYGYNRCRDEKELERKLWALYKKQIAPAREKGLAAAIYTQLTDVEDELNGLVTYDRAMVKLPPETVRGIIS